MTKSDLVQNQPGCIASRATGLGIAGHFLLFHLSLSVSVRYPPLFCGEFPYNKCSIVTGTKAPLSFCLWA